MRHQGLCPGIEETGVKCLYLGSDILLQVNICCKSLASQVLLTESKEREIIGLTAGKVAIISQQQHHNQSQAQISVEPSDSIHWNP